MIGIPQDKGFANRINGIAQARISLGCTISKTALLSDINRYANEMG